MIDAELRGLVSKKGPGFALAIVDDGEVVFKRGYGLANIKKKIRIGARTSFRLASVSKPVTAVGALVLVESGALELDDPVSKHVSGFPYPSITVEHLLHHTSGLPHYDDFPESFERKRPTNKDALDHLAKRRPKTLFSAGQRFDYNNLGYDMLALVIEGASGVSFSKHMRSAVFEPLGMSDTQVFDAAVDIPRRALGYQKSRRGVTVNDDDLLNNLVGAGGIYSTLDDMIRFEAEVRSPRLLSKATWKRALRPPKLRRGRSEYGHGFEVIRDDGVVVVRHGGSWVGFNNDFETLPKEGRAVILLTNANWDLGEIIDTALDALD